MKFTEEQFKNIVEAWEKTYDYVLSVKNVIETVESFGEGYEFKIGEALALANAVSSEWAHEQFVEKEKKYVWTTPLVAGIKYALIKENGKYVLSDMYLTGKGTPLTELEVVNIGLKTDWFNKEEAE